ncbi:hypothetical protein HJB51_00430 [Rhizobium lentis]|nr:hypothetical protein [Rhizobium lentis]MBX5017915.1 hypothetical protein [Rhizobium lentis]MBX5042642.1 hypothetical protein [Rhizobium lentis]MBX5072476.1 hypothetical protein [Rhizobium lentis]MBX5106479.1 hypothetical protein [Rhizobium lentis]MBX5113194.1 hypothetical protein [Rhizobium lentis]
MAPIPLGTRAVVGAAAWRMEEFALVDSYDRVSAIYKLNIDHVYIADL